MKCKHYEIVTRPEFLKEKVGDIIRRYSTIKRYAYILHDKDDAEPHYHIYINFGKSGVESKLVAEWFGLQESQINRVKGRMTDMLQYLTHSQPSQQNKHQYSPDEVISNFDFLEEIRKSKILGNFKEYSYAEQLKYVDSLPVDEKPTAHNKLDNLYKLHCKLLTLNPNRDIDVMFVWGQPGVGKTYFSKLYAERQKYDVSVSSASNDVWQDYLGQRCMILDDFRDSTLSTNIDESFTDLLKMIDPYTNSTLKGRYNNKVFAGELIIITSSVALRYWFPEYRMYKRENLFQLYRRFSYYVKVYENYIEIYNKVNSAGEPDGIPVVVRTEVADLKKKPREKSRNLDDTFAKHFEVIPFDEYIYNNKPGGG